MTITQETGVYTLEELGKIVVKKANAVIVRVDMFKADRDCDNRNDILTTCNEVTGMFHLLLELNGLRDIPTVRETVTVARQAVQELYFRRGRPPQL